MSDPPEGSRDSLRIHSEFLNFEIRVDFRRVIKVDYTIHKINDTHKLKLLSLNITPL